MKAVIAVLILIYTIFVFAVGETAQKGMLLSVLVLLAAIYLFYKYANFARMVMRRYDELKRAVFTADLITGFISQLESQKDNYAGKQVDPGVEVNHAVGLLKRAKLRAGASRKQEETPVTTQEDNPQTSFNQESLTQR